MLSRKRLCGAAAGVVSLLLTPLTAHATNGYFAHGYSASQDALGGAGTAMVEDAMVVSINPAGAVWTDSQLDFAISVFSPRRYYGATDRGSGASTGVVTIGPTGDNVRSDNEFFLIPGFAYNRKLSRTAAVGVAMFGNGGMNTKYSGGAPAIFGQNLPGLQSNCQGTFGGGMPVPGTADAVGFCGRTSADASVDLIQVFVTPYYSQKIGHSFSVGIEPIFAAQRFRAYGLNAFAAFSNAPNKVSDKGYDLSFGVGGRVGFLWDVFHGVGIGASYQTRVYMTKLKKYSGLFAEGGRFDIPSSFNIGLQLHPLPNHRFVFDFQRINFHEVAAVGNALNPNSFINNCAVPRLMAKLSGGLAGNAGPSDYCLGAAGGPGFGWRDVIVYKFGYQYQYHALKLRVGYSFIPHQPIPQGEVLFNILAPAVPMRHITGGVSYRFSSALSFDMTYMYALGNTVVGPNPLSNAPARVLTGGQLIGFNAGYDAKDQSIRLNMRQFMATVGFSYHFYP